MIGFGVQSPALVGIEAVVADGLLAFGGNALDGVHPYRIHASEGAIFHWLCFPKLPITAKELYRRLKERGLIVVPGHYFFFGSEGHPHEHNCIRLTYSQDGETVQGGIGILADTLRGEV